jgi:hypothetical protein
MCHFDEIFQRAGNGASVPITGEAFGGKKKLKPYPLQV